MNKSKLSDVILIALFLSFFSSTAYAYIDPGSGSIILASIVAGFVTIRTAIKLYWQKFCGLFTKHKPESKKVNNVAASKEES